MSSDNTTVDISIGDELEDLKRNFDMIMTNEEKRMSLEQFFTYMYRTIQSNKFQNIIRSNRAEDLAPDLTRISTILKRMSEANRVEDKNEAAILENGAKNGIVDVLSRLKYLSQLDPVSLETGSLPLTKNELRQEEGSAVVGREATTKQPPRVFISYTKEDTRAANKLYNDLKLAGVYPWLDSESLLAGQNWKVAIKHVIRNSRYFILLLSTNSVDKEGNIQAETQESLDLLKDFSPSEIFVIPVRLDNCTILDQRLKDLHMIDMFSDWELGIQGILKSMGVGEEQGSIIQEQSYSALNDSTWTELLRYITEEKCNPFVGPEAHSRWIPTDEHIAVKWAESFGYPFQDSFQLPQVSQFLAIRNADPLYPKKLLSIILKEIKVPDFSLPEYQNTVYATLADLNLPIYVTTNYDHFMEAALESKGRDPSSEFCRWNSDIDQYARRSGIDSVFNTKGYKPKVSSPLVYHLHGDMNEPVSMVLTERDYSNFVMNIGSQNDQHILPRIIQQSLVKSSQLLIGYSLQDVNSRSLLGSIARFWESLAPPMVIGIISPEMDVGYNYPQAKNYLDSYAKDILKLNIVWSDPFIFSNQLRARVNEFKKSRI